MKRLSSQNIIGAVVLTSLILAGCGGARSADGGGDGETFTLNFAHVTTESTPKGQAAVWFEEELEERTDGRIEVEVYPNSELYGDKDEMQAIQSNSVQMLAPASAKFTTIAPALQVLDLPFLFDGPEEIPEVAASDTAVGEAIFSNENLANNGMKVLSLWDNGFKQIHSNNKTVEPSDMEGNSYRIQPSDVLQSQIQAWGGEATPLAFAEVYNSLQQGLLDGGENTFSNIESQNMHTVQDHIAESNHGYIGYVQVINQEFFDSLPEDLQQIVLDVSEEASEYNRETALELNEESKAAIEEAGATEITVWGDEEREAFEDAVIPEIYEEYRDVIGDEIIDELLANKE